MQFAQAVRSFLSLQAFINVLILSVIKITLITFLSCAVLNFLDAGPLCQVYLRQLERLGLKQGTHLHAATRAVVENSSTAKFFEESYARAQRAHLNGSDFILELAREMQLPLVPKHLDDLFPKEGPLILQANHPFGILEALVLYEYAARNRPLGNVFGLVTDTAIEFLPEIKPHVIPVDIYSNANNREVMTQAGSNLKLGKVCIIFPRGHVSRRLNIFTPSTSDEGWHPGATLLAVRNKTQVLQVHVEGSNTRITDLLLLMSNKLKSIAQSNLLSKTKLPDYLTLVADRFALATIPWENARRARLGFSVKVGEAFSYQDILEEGGSSLREQTDYIYNRYTDLRDRSH